MLARTQDSIIDEEKYTAIAKFIKAVIPHANASIKRYPDEVKVQVYSTHQDDETILHNFSYAAEVFDDNRKLFADLVTDIAINYFIKHYHLEKYIQPREGYARISFPSNLFLGHAGLTNFWDVEQLSFDWQAFQRFKLTLDPKPNFTGTVTEKLTLFIRQPTYEYPTTGKHEFPFQSAILKLEHALGVCHSTILQPFVPPPPGWH